MRNYFVIAIVLVEFTFLKRFAESFIWIVFTITCVVMLEVMPRSLADIRKCVVSLCRFPECLATMQVDVYFGSWGEGFFRYSVWFMAILKSLMH